jgi:hypothetical protein
MTTESAFNPFQANVTKLAHLVELRRAGRTNYFRSIRTNYFRIIVLVVPSSRFSPPPESPHSYSID